MLVGQIGFLNMREFYVLFDVKFYCKLFYPIYYAAKVMYPEFQMPSHKCLSVRKEMKICVFLFQLFGASISSVLSHSYHWPFQAGFGH